MLIQALKSQGMISETATSDSVATLVKQFRNEQQAQVNAIYNKALKGEGKFPGFIRISQGSGDAANMANYLAGVAYYHMAQYKDAIKHLEAFSPKTTTVSARWLCMLWQTAMPATSKSTKP